MWRNKKYLALFANLHELHLIVDGKKRDKGSFGSDVHEPENLLEQFQRNCKELAEIVLLSFFSI